MCEGHNNNTRGGTNEHSEFNDKADVVKSCLEVTRKALEGHLDSLQACTQQWSTVDRLKESLISWMNENLVEVSEFEQCPAKLHVEAATLEISHIQVRS